MLISRTAKISPSLPARPASLVIIFQAVGHIVVDDRTNIRFVDPHSKSIGGHHDPGAVVPQSSCLAAFPHALTLHDRKLPGCRACSANRQYAWCVSGFYSKRWKILLPCPGSPAFWFDVMAARSRCRRYSAWRRIAESEDANRQIAIAYVQMSSCTSRVADAVSAITGTPGSCSPQAGDPPVGWPEVVSPLGNAVRFIYCHQAGLIAGRYSGTGCFQPFRRYVEKFIIAKCGVLQGLSYFQKLIPEWMANALIPFFLQVFHLVFHQGNEGLITKGKCHPSSWPEPGSKPIFRLPWVAMRAHLFSVTAG